MDNSSVIEIPAFLEKQIVKTITFSDEGIKIEKPRSFISPVFIKSEDITAFRYRVTWTRGYKFVFGRQYLVEIKDSRDNIFKFKLNSVYGIRRKTYYKIWSDIISALWDHYFKNTFSYYTDLYNIQQPFEIAGVIVKPEGLSWDKNNLFWGEVALSNYRTYFMIYNAGNPKQNKSCSFANDWNALVLQMLLKHIIKKFK